MSQIALVSNQHDHDVCIRMVAQLLQPSSDVVIGLMLADIVDQQCSDCASVICGCDSPVALLPCSIPDLCFDGLRIDLDRPCGELDTDGGL